MKDEVLDRALRPTTFDGYIGQDHVKQVLFTAMEAAKMNDEPLDHILLTGGPGLGKTTLANIIASAMEIPIYTYMGTLLKSPQDIYTAFFKIKMADRGIVFIDEIHRVWVPIQELLYPPLEDRFFNYKVGNASTMVQIPGFTMIGATTIPGKLAQPFLDRFPLKFQLQPYDNEQLSQILRLSAKKLSINLDDAAIMEIVVKSRKTPRVANNLLRRVRDFATVDHINSVDGEYAKHVLQMKGLVAVSG